MASKWVERAEAHKAACGQRLRAARAEAGLSAYALGDLIGMPKTSNVITRYEDGAMPSMPRMYAIAEALGVDVNDIWGFWE